MKTTYSTGYIDGMLSAVAAAVAPVMAVLLLEGDVDAVSALFWRFAIALPALWLFLHSRGRHVTIGSGRVVPVGLAGILFGFSALLLVKSFEIMDVGLAMTEFFTYPLFVTLLVTGFFHERLKGVSLLGILLCIAGIFIMSSMSRAAVFSPAGLLLALGSAALMAVVIMMINSERLRDVSTLAMNFWMTVVCVVMFGAFSVFRWSLAVPQGVSGWMFEMLFALCPTIVAFIFTERAVNRIGKTRTSVCVVAEPLVVVVFAAMFLGQIPDWRELAGIIVVVGSIASIIGTRNVSRRIIKIRHLLPSAKRSR